jgi:hypothetical protein
MSFTPVCDLDSPSDRFDDVTVRVTPLMLKRNWQEMKHRLGRSACAHTEIINIINLSLSSANQTLRHENVWESGCIDPHFLDLGTSWT